MGDAAAILTILASLPAFVTGVVAGFLGRSRPKIRRGLMIAFAVLASLGAFALYAFAAPRCVVQGDAVGVLSRGVSPCGPSWKDAAGAFAGAEVAIAFQAVVAWLFATMARKYPLRGPAA